MYLNKLILALILLLPAAANSQVIRNGGFGSSSSGSTETTFTIDYASTDTNQYAFVYIKNAGTISGDLRCISSVGTYNVTLYQSDLPHSNSNPSTLATSTACSTTLATKTPGTAAIAAGKYLRFVFDTPASDPLGSVELTVQ